jgi:hypothetical protein
VQGWILLDDGAPDSVELVSAQGATVAAACCARPDLKKAFPDHRSALQAGYQASLPEAVFRNSADQYEFTIIARRGPQVAFRCLVVQQSTENSSTSGPYSTNDGVLYI